MCHSLKLSLLTKKMSTIKKKIADFCDDRTFIIFSCQFLVFLNF